MASSGTRDYPLAILLTPGSFYKDDPTPAKELPSFLLAFAN